MAVKRRVFSRDFKLQVVREVEAGKSQAQIAREHRISQNLISRWCRQSPALQRPSLCRQRATPTLTKPASPPSSGWSAG